MVKTHVTPKLRKRSQSLRRQLTKSEALLWNELRDLRKLHGLHFRRQSPIGPYIVDFVCFAARLVVEVDGDSHETEQGKVHDQRRDAYLRGERFHILRFPNPDVQDNAWQIAQEILDVTKGSIENPTRPTAGAAVHPPREGEGKSHQPFLFSSTLLMSI